MPTYAELLADAVPAVIESERQYAEVIGRFGELITRGKRRTADETRLMRLLGLLIEDYDRQHALPPDGAAPGEKLRFLMEHSGKTAADLIPVFGQRSHVSEVLNGKRKISLQHARELGKLFGVKAWLFV
jgi:HTH-type transcriptional regulator / antitoxin HigA